MEDKPTQHTEGGVTSFGQINKEIEDHPYKAAGISGFHQSGICRFVAGEDINHNNNSPANNERGSSSTNNHLKLSSTSSPSGQVLYFFPSTGC
jgi:hypothetical protein